MQQAKVGHSKWICKCECGKEIEVFGTNLIRKHTISCGCMKGYYISKAKIKHGKTHTRLYSIFNKMKDRCCNQNNPAYKNYGARGIKICNEWLDKENGFVNFYNWAINNGYKENLTIDRVDNNGNYEPNNCRWVTYQKQNNNKRNNHLITYNNITHNLTEWSKIIGINTSTIYGRINRNIPKEYWLYKGKIPYQIEKEARNVKR